MIPPGPLTVLILQVATVLVAALGVARLTHLYRLARDRRVARLAAFFGLLAAAVAVQIIVTAGILLEGRPEGRPPRPSAWTGWLHHGLMLLALAVAVRAYGRPRTGTMQAAALGILFGPAGVLRLVEAGLTLYLAVRAVVNQQHRGTRGSLYVAGGFFLFFLGHLSFWVFHPVRGPRPYWAEALALAGVILLVSRIPGRRH